MLNHQQSQTVLNLGFKTKQVSCGKVTYSNGPMIIEDEDDAIYFTRNVNGMMVRNRVSIKELFDQLKSMKAK